MSLPEEFESACAIAVERFRQGKCPCCGKGFGEPRGLEYRKAPDDIYCHSCKITWPMELDLEVLRAQLALRESPAPDIDYAPVESMASETTLAERWGVVTWVGRIFQRMVTR